MDAMFSYPGIRSMGFGRAMAGTGFQGDWPVMEYYAGDRGFYRLTGQKSRMLLAWLNDGPDMETVGWEGVAVW